MKDKIKLLVYKAKEKLMNHKINTNNHPCREYIQKWHKDYNKKNIKITHKLRVLTV